MRVFVHRRQHEEDIKYLSVKMEWKCQKKEDNIAGDGENLRNPVEFREFISLNFQKLTPREPTHRLWVSN